MLYCVCVFPGLEELVLSEINSPNRSQQRGDSSSVSSFSYGEIMKEGASAQSTNKVHYTSQLESRQDTKKLAKAHTIVVKAIVCSVDKICVGK